MLDTIQQIIITYGPTVVSVVSVILGIYKVYSNIKASNSETSKEVKMMGKRVDTITNINQELLLENRALKRENREIKEMITHVKIQEDQKDI